MKLRILAADSMGVRSIATVVEACGYTIGIDLGASIAPRRYGLPPHDLELKRLNEAINSCIKWVNESDVIVITHYHYDHYLRDRPDLYKGKLLLVKDPKREINRSQAIRAYRFLKKSRLYDHARVEHADSRTFRLGRLIIELSRPVWHGEPGTKVGKVLMVRVECDGESLVFTSDVQGPADPDALRILREWSAIKPNVVIVGGPPTYFAGVKVSRASVDAGLSGLMSIIKEVRPETVIVDHHLLRDIGYKKYISEHYRMANALGVKLLTAAEFMNRPIEQLEARRKELWRVSR